MLAHNLMTFFGKLFDVVGLFLVIFSRIKIKAFKLV